ncbi:VOC family protein [Oricola sp.]|uniref:VOC family protein n=1 Tax=Oricola sp. TaxID=1979950 RepID=UPI003BA8A04B
MPENPDTIDDPAAIDHVVLPVGSLAVTRVRLSSLGFTVAQDAIHPFGTENACVYFADGTFLEPLAVAQRETCERTASKGNVFTARDQAYRFRRGEDGFSALAMATTDATRDHNRFKREGVSAGRKLAFGRRMTMPDGRAETASFRLAFAADLRSPDAFFFVCERVRVPQIDMSELRVHDNGASGIAEVVLSEANPTDFQYLLQAVLSNRETEAHSFGMQIAAANGLVDVMTPEGLTAHYGSERKTAGRGLCLEGFVLRCRSLPEVRNLLEQRGVEFHECIDTLIVPAAPGQGCFIAFREPPNQ